VGLRFRRSLRIAPGVKINLGLKSVSASFGGRGLWYTVGPRGQRFTAGMPRTGLYWTTQSSWNGGNPRAGYWIAAVILVLAALIAIALL
jgi:hypothetical protein